MNPRQLISSIGWSEGLTIYNGRLEASVLEVINDDNVRLWVKNGSWEGIYNHQNNTILVIAKDTLLELDGEFFITENTDNFTGYGNRVGPMTASESKEVAVKTEHKKLEDRNWFYPCDECGAFKVSCLCKVPF